MTLYMMVTGHVIKQAHGPRDLPGLTQGATGALTEAPLPPRARGSASWPPCLAQQPLWFWGKRHLAPRLHGSSCTMGHNMDPCLIPGPGVTPYRIILSPRDLDTTSWSPSLFLQSSLGKQQKSGHTVSYDPNFHRKCRFSVRSRSSRIDAATG
jgi:hypothetical protein